MRDKGNPIEKCAGQRKSYRKMCGTKEILLKSWKKTSQSEPHPSPRPRDLRKSWKNLTICGPSPGPRKSWKKTSQYYGFACLLVVGVPTSCAEAPCGGNQDKGRYHPLDLRKSWKKPHNLRTITGTPEILEKNLTILRICLLLLVGWLVGLFRQAVQRPPAGAINPFLLKSSSI